MSQIQDAVFWCEVPVKQESTNLFDWTCRLLASMILYAAISAVAGGC